ncbi:hypothetical protein JB92DRAFT_2854543 [Gautieria morchelliformis]|nr:hypothetical protein JB92DRAFT_2854543 [Gautieria morchelliformis]
MVPDMCRVWLSEDPSQENRSPAAMHMKSPSPSPHHGRRRPRPRRRPRRQDRLPPRHRPLLWHVHHHMRLRHLHHGCLLQPPRRPPSPAVPRSDQLHRRHLWRHRQRSPGRAHRQQHRPEDFLLLLQLACPGWPRRHRPHQYHSSPRRVPPKPGTRARQPHLPHMLHLLSPHPPRDDPRLYYPHPPLQHRRQICLPQHEHRPRMHRRTPRHLRRCPALAPVHSLQGEQPTDQVADGQGHVDCLHLRLVEHNRRYRRQGLSRYHKCTGARSCDHEPYSHTPLHGRANVWHHDYQRSRNIRRKALCVLPFIRQEPTEAFRYRR